MTTEHKPISYETIVTKVARHLFRQNEKAMARIDGTLQCAYRSTDGKRRCAIGALITNKEYDPSLELFHPSELISRNRLSRYTAHRTRDELYELVDLFANLQIVHDQYSVRKWRYALIQLVKRWNIDVNINRIYDAVQKEKAREVLQ